MTQIHLRKSFFENNLTLSFLGLACFISACLLNTNFRRPVLEISKQETAINVQTVFLQALSAGHKRLITDLLWIQTLLESDLEHYKKKDLNNWLFLRFNTISVLDPRFYENYLYGGQFLNVVKDDLEGAKIIYEKGIGQFPNDYRLLYQTGFLYYFEAGELERGLELLSKIERHPQAPVYLPSIINKLRFQVTGDLEAVYQLVYLNWIGTKDKYLKEKIEKDLYAIRAEIDLKCLNSHQSSCNHKDLHGTPYHFDGTTYSATQNFKPFRIKTRQDRK